MLAPSDYLRVLGDAGVTFFTGVPDSLLKEFCACVTMTLKPEDHLIAANEGASVGLQSVTILALVLYLWFICKTLAWAIREPAIVAGKP